MKYRVRIVIKEVYTTWVEAENEDAAEEAAWKQLDDGDLYADHETSQTDIIDTDDGGN